MPTPHPDTETKTEFMDRCVPMVMDDGSASSSDQAVAMCSQMWSDAMKGPMPMRMKRAYSTIDFRSVDEEKRIIEGIASTPEVDSYRTVLEPEGAKFTLPIPVLYQHNAKQPIGRVVEAQVGKSGIRVRIELAKPGVAGFIDEAWSLIRAGLIRGLSVGFDPIKETWDKTFDGIRFLEWRWLELSTVTIPANTEANMTSVRSADEAVLAASGNKARYSAVRLNTNLPASGPTQGKAMKNLDKHIAALTAKRDANLKRIEEIEEKAVEESRSRDAAEFEECQTLERENEALEKDIEDFTKRQKTQVMQAAAVTAAAAGQDPEKIAQQQRRGEAIQVVGKNEPKGIGMARMAIAMVRSHREHRSAVEIAQQMWKDSPEVAQYIRAAVEAGDTTTSGWASQLLPGAQTMANEFIEMLRAKTLIGRLNLRSVPFNVSVPLQSAAGTYGWVGEGAPKPVTKPTYGSATLRFEKMAGIIVITQELARFSSPSAELLVRNEMVNGMTRAFDTHFVSTTAAVTNVSPAGILNGISSTAVTGTTAAKFRVDMNTIIQKMITNNQNPATAAIIMSSGMAMSLASMITTLGTKEFPSINATGGDYNGIPIFDTQTAGTNIILIQPQDILHASDPSIRIDVSTEASVEMDTVPAQGESSPITDVATLKSFWQNNLVGIRAEQFNTWKVSRTSAVEYLTAAAYAPS